MKKSVKIVSMLLALVLLCGGAGAYAHGQATASPSGSPAAPAVSADVGHSAEAGKDETVYVLGDAEGGVQKVIVSARLRNPAGAAELADFTRLRELVNVKGDGAFTPGRDGEGVWAAGGQDVYYQGTTAEQPPVKVTLQYLLNGQPVNAAQLAGQSGRVTIRFRYENTLTQTATVNGEEQRIHVPFLALSGLILDHDRFANVAVSNGKVIDDGDRSLVVGYALPGLQASLGLTDEQLQVPDTVEITADATDFSLAATMTLVTNEPFSELNLEGAEDLQGLQDALNEMAEAADQLEEGSGALYEGLSTLCDKTGDLTQGIAALSGGADSLQQGTSALCSGANELQQGLQELNEGLEALSGQSGKLNAGAKQVFDSLLQTANTQLKAGGLSVPKLTISNYAQTLDGVIASLDEAAVRKLAYNQALQTVTQQVEANEPTIRAGVEQAVRVQVLEAALAQAGLDMTAEQYEQALAAGSVPAAMQQQLETAVSQQMQSAAVQARIKAAVREQKEALIAQNMEGEEVTAAIAAAVTQAQNGRSSVAALKEQLQSYQAFYDGLQAYTAGVGRAEAGGNELVQGARQLASGAGEVQEGAGALAGGIHALAKGGAAMADGTTQLRAGAHTLRAGMTEFNEKAVQKLTEAFNGDFQALVDRLQAIADASQAYRSFSGAPEGLPGSVRFIYRTEGIARD